MPTLDALVDLEIPAFETVQESDVFSNEARSALSYFNKSLQRDFYSSEFLGIETRFGKLRSSLVTYSRLSDDWDSYGAEKPSRHTVELTGRLLDTLRGELFLPVRLIPSAEGGIAAYFKSGDRVSYLEYRNSGEVILAMYDRQNDPDVRELTENDSDQSRAIALIREYITA